MSSRFSNLIKKVVDKFEEEDYNLLLTEALSLTQIQDQLKEKNVDLTAYNPKHYLFLLALLNSNLNLDVYNQLITSIKDQGILNRVLSMTVDRRSNTPTVDGNIINRIIQNTSNLPELNAILNSIGQKRETPTPVASEEEKTKGTEDFATRIKKEVAKGLAAKFDDADTTYILNNIIGELIDNEKKRFPNDRLVHNYSYALPLASYFMNLPASGAVGVHISKLESLLYQLFPKYMADDDIREKKLIFKDPYKNNFYEFSNYLYQYFREKRFREEGKDGDLMNAYVFKNEDVTVYSGTVESTHDSIRRCIKYGKGVNPKYGLCISGSSAGRHYPSYRFESGGRKNLTTYFVYFNKPEDIKKYNSEFFLFEPYYNNNNELTYQFNPGAGNPGETQISPENAIIKYPMLKEPLEQGVFKVVEVNEKEKGDFFKIRDATIEKLENVDDLIDWIEATDPHLTSETFKKIQDKFPEGLVYALDFYIKRRIDFAEDEVDNNYIVQSRNSLEYYVFGEIEGFLRDNPELKNRYEKIRPTLKLKEIRIVTNNGQLVTSEYFEKLAKEYPEYVEKALSDYIISRENSWSPNRSNLYHYVFNSLGQFFEKYPQYQEKYKDKINDFEIKEMDLLISSGRSTNSEYFEKFSERHPTLVDDALDRYINKQIEMYFDKPPRGTLRSTVFAAIIRFIYSKEEYKEKYKISPELKQKELDFLLKNKTEVDHYDLMDLKNDYPDFLFKFLDEYIKNRSEYIIKNNRSESELKGYIKMLYRGIYIFFSENPEIKKRYINYEKELVVHYIDTTSKTHILVTANEFNDIKKEYPDIVEKCVELYLNNKIELLTDISYNFGNGKFYTSKDDQYDFYDISELYIKSDTIYMIQSFISQDTNLEKKVAPLINEIQKIQKINGIILTNNILDSEELEDLQKLFSEDDLKVILDRYFESRLKQFFKFVETNNYNINAPFPSKGDMEEQLFLPLRKFFYYNPKLAEKYKDTQKELKLKAFQVCGRREDEFVDHDRIHEFDYNTMYLTSEWLQDVQNRFPDILEQGLELYLNQKLKQNIQRNTKKSSYDRDEYQLVNMESEVFKRIHDFERNNKSLFEKYSSERMASIKRFINNMKFDDLLNSNFFFRLEETFRPTFYRVIFKEYIERKIAYIEEVKFRKKRESEEDDGWVSDEGEFSKVSNEDLYGYIFDPLEEFIKTHPELTGNYGERTKDLKYQFLVKYFTTPKDTVDNDLKNKALKYISYLNNNNQDNSEIYQRIVNELIYLNGRTSLPETTLKSYASFYENIDDKVTLKQIFSIDSNKKHLFNTIKDNDSDRITKDYKQGNVIFFHELIKFKIKSSKLKNANPKSFYRMINEIIPNVGDLIIKELFNEIKNQNQIKLTNMLDVFFDNKELYDYINDNKSFRNGLLEAIKNINIVNISFSNIRATYRDNSLKTYLEFIKQFPDYYNTDDVYKATIDHDEKQIKQVKTQLDQKNNIIHINNLNINFFYTPPDLSKATIKSTYSGEVSIEIKCPYPIKTLKFLPYAFGTNSAGKIDLTDCILENNIDYLPVGTTNLELTKTVVSSDKELISKSVATSSLRTISLRGVKNLKTLKGLNVNTLYRLKIFKCDELVSLKGSPNIVNELEITGCDSLKTLKGSPLESNVVQLMYMHELLNFTGIPRAKKYLLQYNTINSFKGLPNKIIDLEIHDSVENKHLVRKSYSYFPNEIDSLTIRAYATKQGKSSFPRYLFSRIKNVFPSFIGNVDDYLLNRKTDPFEKEIYKIYREARKQRHNKGVKEKETAERIAQERTPTKEDELEAIETQQDKATNKEKIKRLRKEDLELVAPFNVLLEDILNTIKTSFKVYK